MIVLYYASGPPESAVIDGQAFRHANLANLAAHLLSLVPDVEQVKIFDHGRMVADSGPVEEPRTVGATRRDPTGGVPAAGVPAGGVLPRSGGRGKRTTTCRT